MNKNDPEIQKFLDTAKAETENSPKACDIEAFDEFWTEKYSADDTNFSYKAFLGDAATLLSHNQVTYYKELTSYKKGISAIVLPVKKVIRKMVAFLFLPVIAEQNEINLSNTRIIEHLRSYVNKDVDRRNQLTLREKEMELQLKSQQELISQLTEKLDQLSAQVEQLSKGGNKQ